MKTIRRPADGWAWAGVDHAVFNSHRQRILNRVRVAQGEDHRGLALQLGAIADADDFQFAGPALGDTFDRVVDQGAGQSMNSGLRVVLADRDQVAVLLLHAMPRGNWVSSLPLGPCTLTTVPSILTATPLGSGIGFLPILDISFSS